MAKPHQSRYPSGTSIRLTYEQRQLLRVAAGIFNLSYQEYLRAVALTHAEHVIRYGLMGNMKLIEGLGRIHRGNKNPKFHIEILENYDDTDNADRTVDQSSATERQNIAR